MPLSFHELKALLIKQFGEELMVAENTQALQPSLTVATPQIAAVCQFLYENEQTYFDLLECLTAIDNGPEQETMEIVYHLCSIPYEHTLVLKIVFPRNQNVSGPLPAGSQQVVGSLPVVPTVSHIWQTANWHEREAYDLMGIEFAGHPDLRRILLPADWHGHPLRKDYTEQETYHGIKVKY